MPIKSDNVIRSKVKIVTILDRGIVERLKARAAREGKTISSLMEDAVCKYMSEDTLERQIRLKALDQLFSIRFNISIKDWKTIIEEDYYEQ